MSDLVGNPEDRFSHNKAHLFCNVSPFTVAELRAEEQRQEEQKEKCEKCSPDFEKMVKEKLRYLVYCNVMIDSFGVRKGS